MYNEFDSIPLPKDGIPGLRLIDLVPFKAKSQMDWCFRNANSHSPSQVFICSSFFTNTKGSLQIESVEKFGLLSQLRGGGLPIPNFDSIFPRVFLLQYGRGSPVPTNKITKNHIKNPQSPKKCDFSMKKIICLE